MTSLRTAILSHEEKEIARRAMFLYIAELQKHYYNDKTVTSEEYDLLFAQVDDIIDKLHLRNVPPE
jgi:hypothetical protein